MKKFILTISREFGCNAREITRETAAHLGIDMYDRDLINLTAERAGINMDAFADNERLVDKSAKNLLSAFTYGSSTSFYSDKAIVAQAEVIREIADGRKPVIFFGRCADYILREYPNCFNVFLYAPLKKRIAHISQAYGLTEDTAARLIRRVDKQRHNYYKYVTGKNRGDREYKQLMIDVSDFGTEGTVKLICQIIQDKFGDG